MTIKAIQEHLGDALDRLLSAEVEDESTLDLEILLLHLKKLRLQGGFDPLKELCEVTVAELYNLPQMIEALDEVMEDELKRITLVRKILLTARIGLKGAGLPLPD